MTEGGGRRFLGGLLPVLHLLSSALRFLPVRHDDKEPAAFAFDAPDFHPAAEQFDALADIQQSESRRMPEFLRIETATAIALPHAPFGGHCGEFAQVVASPKK